MYCEILSIIIKWDWEVGSKSIVSQIVFHKTYFVPGDILEQGWNRFWPEGDYICTGGE